MTDSNNRRDFTRLALPLTAEVHLGGIALTGTVRDISRGGCFVECDSGPDAETEGVLRLFYPERREEMEIEAAFRVIRSTADGAALEFVGVALESCHHLHHLLLMNAGDADAVQAEVASTQI